VIQEADPIEAAARAEWKSAAPVSEDQARAEWRKATAPSRGPKAQVPREIDEQGFSPEAMNSAMAPEPTAEEAAAGVARLQAGAATPGQVAGRAGRVALGMATDLGGSAVNAVKNIPFLPSELAGAGGAALGRLTGSQQIEQGSKDFLRTTQSAKAASDIPTDPEDPASQIGGGLGLMGAAVASGGLAPAAAIFGASNGVALHQKILDETGDPVKAMAGLIGGGVAGAGLSMLPAARVLARINGESGGVLVRAFGDVGASAGSGFLYGAGQSAINDTIEQYATGKDIPILQNALEQGGYGTAMSLIGEGVGAAVGKLSGKTGHVPTDTAPTETAPTIESALQAENAAPIEQSGNPGELPKAETAPPGGGEGSGEAVPRENVAEGKASAALTPEASKRADELLAMPREKLEQELVDRLALEDATLREQKPGREEAWYQRVAELRRQARDEGNPEAERAAEQLKAAKIKPSGQLVEEVISALNVRDDMTTAERLARKGTRPSQKFERAQAARAEIEQAWREFGDSLRGKAFSTAGGLDPEVLGKAAKVAKAYVKAGTQGFIDFAHDAIARFGEAIRPHVHDIWRKAGGSPQPMEERAKVTGEEVPAKRPLPIKKKATEPKPEIPVAKVEAAPEAEKPTIPVEKVEKPGIPLKKTGEREPEHAKPAAFDHTFGGNLKGLTVNEESARELFRREIVDQFSRVRDAEKAVGAKGDLSAQETVFHGRVGARADWINRRVADVVKVAREGGINLKELGDFLYARHVADREKALGEGTAGMSAADAQKILDEAAKNPAFARAAQIHDAIQQRKLDMLEEAGNLSAKERRAWEEKFGPTYTPLKTVNEPAETHIRGQGGSFNIKGREAKTAKGRKSEAFNPLVQSVADAYEATFRSEKNRVGNELLKVVREKPAPELWQEYADANDIPVKERDQVFHTKENGEDRYIVIRDKKILESLKGLGMDQVPRVLRWASSAAALYKSFHTTKNPQFLITNFAKDIQEAGLNVGTTQSAKLAAKVVGGAPRAIKVMWDVLGNENAPGKLADYAREFRDEGGMTNWVDRKSVHKIEDDVRKALERGHTREVLGKIPELVEQANESVENGVRLSTYIEMREAGHSKRDSAVAAKSVTVNFDRKGNLSPVLNTLYLFFNAGVQGTATTVRILRSNPKKAAAAMGGMAAAGFLISLHNRLVGGEDPKDGENRWERESLDHKAHSFEWMFSDGSTWKFPLPWLWGLPFHMGTLAEHIANGKTKPAAATGSMTTSFVDAVSPVSGGSVGQFFAPWFADPFVSADENKNFRGSPIHPDTSESPLPSSSRRTYGATSGAVALSSTINSATGGDAGRKGSIDIPPDTLDYLAGEAFGGAGRFAQRVWKTAENKLEGKETPWVDVPFLSAFMGEPSKNIYQSEFRADVKQIEAEMAAQKAGTPYDETAAQFGASTRGNPSVRARYEKAIKAARDAGDDDEANNLAAEFHKMFTRRGSPR
jgi:hypothetical protein